MIASDPYAQQRPFLIALYAVAAALVLPTTIEFVLVSLPLRFGDARWRFGAGGLLFNNVALLPLAGLALAAFASLRLGHRVAARIVAVLLVLMGLGLLVALPLFALDFLQLRPDVNPDMARSVDLTSIKAMITGVLFCIAAFAVGLATWRSSSALGQREREATARRGTLVVGTAPTS